jgi:hypothetical protein
VISVGVEGVVLEQLEGPRTTCCKKSMLMTLRINKRFCGILSTLPTDIKK